MKQSHFQSGLIAAFCRRKKILRVAYAITSTIALVCSAFCLWKTVTLLWRPDMVQLQALHAAVIVFTAFLRVRVFDIDSNFHKDLYLTQPISNHQSTVYITCAPFTLRLSISGDSIATYHLAYHHSNLITKQRCTQAIARVRHSCCLRVSF